MKAAVFLGTGRIEIRDIEIPVPEKNEVLLKIIGCGVCGTDAHIYSGSLNVARSPVVIGHEITGQIETVGADVKRFRAGQVVSVDPVIACGTCEFCHTGRTNLCANQTTIGYVRNGGFAQYMVVPVTHVYPIAPEVGLKGGILVETLACVLNGFDRLELTAGKSVLILGAGTVGCLWNQLVKRTPSIKLLQTEIVPFRARLARELGADYVINPQETDLSGVVTSFCPDGVDYIIDATGDAAAIQQALPLVRKGGTFMIFGICPKEAQIQLSPFMVYQQEMKIIASKMPPQTLDRAVKLIEAGFIDYEKITSKIMRLEDIGDALEMFEKARNEALKIAIDPWL